MMLYELLPSPSIKPNTYCYNSITKLDLFLHVDIIKIAALRDENNLLSLTAIKNINRIVPYIITNY